MVFFLSVSRNQVAIKLHDFTPSNTHVAYQHLNGYVPLQNITTAGNRTPYLQAEDRQSDILIVLYKHLRQLGRRDGRQSFLDTTKK